MLTYVIERKMEVVQTAVAWFIATDKKKMDRDQTTYQAYLSTLCTRGQVLLNYAYGIYIACSVEQSATDKKETGTSTMCPESRIFKKRFRTCMKNWKYQEFMDEKSFDDILLKDMRYATNNANAL